MAIYKIPDNMRVGPPVLRVRNIDTAMAFYENSLGLQVNRSYKANSHGGNYYDDDVVNPIYEIGFKHNIHSSSSYEPFLILKHNPNAKKWYYIQQDFITSPYLFLIERALLPLI